MSTVIRYNKLALGKESSVGPARQVPVYPVKWIASERERERKNVARVIVVASEALR